MCKMHIHTLDLGTVLTDRLRPSERPIAQGVYTRGYGASRCDRTTSEMRGLSPQDRSWDSWIGENAQIHTPSIQIP
jgi:hypothetical protein